MLTFLFPGQGSQIKGMGNQLFDQFPEIVTTADEILNYSIKTLCLEDPKQVLNQTQYTQPALYTVNAMFYYKKMQEVAQQPDFVIGHSLGEYNALLAAKVFDFTTGLKLVKKRAELMGNASSGAMAAILGTNEEQIKGILEKNNLFELVIANYNSYQQFVISGTKKNLEQAEIAFQKQPSISFIPLKVSGAFHSHFMLPAQKEFEEFLKNFKFAIPAVAVLSNLNANFYHPANIYNNLANQISNPVQWTKIIEYLLQYENMIFEEIGPQAILTGLVNRIKNAM